MDGLRQRSTYANVVSTLALIVAIAGIPAAVAVTKAKKNSVTTRSIVNGTIRAADLADGQVTASKLADTVLRQGSTPNADLACDGDERLISGGGSSGNGLVDSYPSVFPFTGSFDNPNAWYARGTTGAVASIVCLQSTPLRPSK